MKVRIEVKVMIEECMIIVDGDASCDDRVCW